MSKKILFNITEDWFFCSHFLDRALAAKREGYSIYVIAKKNSHKNIIENNGINFYELPLIEKVLIRYMNFIFLLKVIFLYRKIK